MVDLTTTNVLLGIMAVVSVLEAIALIVAGVMGMRMYSQLSEQIQAVEARHLTPLTNRMLPLVDEAKTLATQAGPVIEEAKMVMQRVQRIAERAEHSLTRVDGAVQGTIDTAEHTVEKVQGGVRRTAGTVVGVVRGVRTAIETFLTDQPNGTRHTNGTHAPYAAASGVTAAEAARAASAGPRSHVVYPDGPPYPGTNIPPERTP
jgi:uncharacterized protein YoxC